MRLLGATCNTPIGVHARRDASRSSISVTAFVGLPDGSHWIRDELRDASSPRRRPRSAGTSAERLRAAGADELLAEAERAVAAG